jgi:hypothetical protein
MKRTVVTMAMSGYVKTCVTVSVCALWILGVPGCSEQATQPEQEEIFFDQPFPVRFHSGEWSFFIGIAGVLGEPAIAYMKLYAKRANGVEKIMRPSDMNKLTGIEIKTKDEAVAFLRVFSRENLYPIFDEPRAIERAPDECEVLPIEDGFVVKRKLLLSSLVMDKGHPVVVFEEKVSFNGKYALLATNLVEYVPYEQYPFPIIL